MTTQKYAFDGLVFTHGINENPMDRTFPFHIHDDYELLCVVSGKVGYIVEGQIYHLRPGSLMLMRNAETHKLLVNQSEPYERYTLNFSPRLLLESGFSTDILTAFTERELGERNHYAAVEFDGVKPAQIFQKMADGCKSFQPQSVILAHLVSLLYDINAIFRRKPEESPRIPDQSGRQLLDYINGHLTEELSLEQLSTQVHLSVSQMNRVFREVTGTSVYNYILSKRLVAVQERMAKGESALSASQACGFRDYSAFYRLYKKRFGGAPTTARRNVEKN